MKKITDKPFYRISDFLLTAGAIVVGGALAAKALFWVTGDEIQRVHPFQNGRQQGVVIKSDTFFLKTPKQPLGPQPK